MLDQLIPGCPLNKAKEGWSGQQMVKGNSDVMWTYTFVPAEDGVLHHAADGNSHHLVGDLVRVSVDLLRVVMLSSLAKM